MRAWRLPSSMSWPRRWRTASSGSSTDFATAHGAPLDESVWALPDPGFAAKVVELCRRGHLLPEAYLFDVHIVSLEVAPAGVPDGPVFVGGVLEFFPARDLLQDRRPRSCSRSAWPWRQWCWPGAGSTRPPPGSNSMIVSIPRDGARLRRDCGREPVQHRHPPHPAGLSRCCSSWPARPPVLPSRRRWQAAAVGAAHPRRIARRGPDRPAKLPGLRQRVRGRPRETAGACLSTAPTTGGRICPRSGAGSMPGRRGRGPTGRSTSRISATTSSTTTASAHTCCLRISRGGGPFRRSSGRAPTSFAPPCCRASAAAPIRGPWQRVFEESYQAIARALPSNLDGHADGVPGLSHLRTPAFCPPLRLPREAGARCADHSQRARLRARREKPRRGHLRAAAGMVDKTWIIGAPPASAPSPDSLSQPGR